MSPCRNETYRRALLPLASARRPLCDWPAENRTCLRAFQEWLMASSASPSTLHLYGVAARMAFGLLDVSYVKIDLDADLERVRHYVRQHFTRPTTAESYLKGIHKLEAYLRLRREEPQPVRTVNWAYYNRTLPTWLADAVCDYARHCARGWRPDRQRDRLFDLASKLTRPLRWLQSQMPLQSLADLTPARWFAYCDIRLAEGIGPVTLNDERALLVSFLRHAQEQEWPICSRMLKVKGFAEPKRLPRDAPVEGLCRILALIHEQTQSAHAGVRRNGLLDRAWFLTMLHGGLRSGEVRAMRLPDIDWERGQIRIEQSKGLKDRLVPLSPEVVAALRAYLEVRGPGRELPDYVFIYNQKPLSEHFFGGRLRKVYAKRAGVQIHPHQLRHSCATLLLNAGMPIAGVQQVLGHVDIRTTLNYARLYDGTVAADYYRAMLSIEQQMALPEGRAVADVLPGELVALVDSLRTTGTLNETQLDTLATLRARVLRLTEQIEAAR